MILNPISKILTTWIASVAVTVAIIFSRFGSIDDEADSEIEVQTAKLVTTMIGSTAILVLTVLAAVAIYVAVHDEDEEDE